MGMPISLALRGRHAGDDRGAAAWADALAILRDVDRVFSTYRATPCSLGWPRRATSGGLPTRSRRGARPGRARQSAVRWRVQHLQARPRRRLDLDPSGVVKGWAVERAARALEALPAPTSASPQAATWSAAP